MDIRTNAPAYNNKYYLKTTYGGYNKCILIEDNGMCIPNCVGYAYGRFMECANKTACNLPTCDAYLWYGKQDGYNRGAVAKQGAVICYSGGWQNKGHVAFVEQVNNDGSILISQSSYGGTRWESLTLYPPYAQYGLTVQGFIYNPYIDDTTNIKMYGIDVSVHNDINAVDLSGLDFVIIRATWGTNLDEKANEWRLKCESLGIPYGVYCYSYALDDTGAREEAEYILDVIKTWNVQLGVWYDMENDSYKQSNGFVTAEQWTSACRIFCKAIQEAGYYTGIYSSQSYFNSHIHVAEYDKWVASWGTNDGTIQRDTSDMGTILQYTSYPNLDKNVSYCELEHYKSYPVKEDEKEEQKEDDKKEDIMPPIDDDYLFKMSNMTYDFLNWLVHMTPLLVTLYITLADTWGWSYTKQILATMGAVLAFINSILKQSTIGYKEKKKDGDK